MQFGIYLVENGVITCEDFFEAVKLQLRSRPQLGGLAIERRMLTVRQVFTILRQQSDAPADLFGDLAVQAGYLTPEELSTLVHEQLQRVKALGDVLADLGILSQDDLAMHSRDFRRAMQPAGEPELAAAEA